MSLIHCGVGHHPARESNTSCDYCAYAQSKAAVKAVTNLPEIQLKVVHPPKFGKRITDSSMVEVGDCVVFGHLGELCSGVVEFVDNSMVYVDCDYSSCPKVDGELRLSWYVSFVTTEATHKEDKFSGYDLRHA